jgi:hypothetical protein
MKVNIVRYKGQLGTVVSDYNNREIKKFLPINYGSYYSDRLDTINTDFLEEASFDEKIEFIEKSFSWGKVIKVHVIGEYQIIEYETKINKDINFHPYINFCDIGHSYYTLDEALIGVIAYKYDGANSQAFYYVTRMLGSDIHKDAKNYYEE